MVVALLIILLLLWLFGFLQIGNIAVPNITLFTLNNQAITLWNVLILLVILAIIGFLPGPLRIIASILLLFWILSVLGILAIAGLSNVVVLIIIVGLVVFLVGGRFY